MTNPRKLKAAEFSIDDDGLFRELSVYYDEGGINYWNYEQKPRGFYFQAHVFRRSGGMLEWTTGQSGDGYLLLEEAKRFNYKKLETLRDNLEKFAELVSAEMACRNDGYLDRIKDMVLYGRETVSQEPQ